MTGKKIIVSDFDGVLCDSMPECFVSSYNSYNHLNGIEEKIIQMEEASNEERAIFSKLRPYVKSGGDYLFCHWIIKNNISISNFGDFEMLKQQNKEKILEYEAALYSERNRLLKENKEHWLDLNPLFEAGIHLKKIPSFDFFYILTTKKSEYAKIILDNCKIELPEERIFHATQDEKIDRLLGIIKMNNIPNKNVLYIEDQIEFALKAKEIGVNPLLAGWGYVNDIQRQKAISEGIPILSCQNFKDLLDSFSKEN